MLRKIECAAVAQRLAAQARSRLSGANAGLATGKRVCAVQVGGEQQAWYVNARKHAERLALKELGVSWETKTMDADSTANEIMSTVAALNNDPSVAGVLVVRPVPEQLSINLLQQAVHPLKDIEGMHPNSIGRVVYGSKLQGAILWPCTAKASVEVLRQGLLDFEGTDSLAGVEVLVVGNSDVLVKPMVSILHGEGATVTVCHPHMANFAAYTRSADVVVSSANLGHHTISGDMLKPGAILLDLGMNVADGKFVGGDVDLNSCGHIKAYSSLAHGIGRVRSAVMCDNLAQAILELRKTSSA
ncbi:C-1-tetrahydrofolate synthase, cytoplasmic [Hondaea fermentalgiana]|uniref:C-1-tetrahydrofolate synthase, cytoplasmic n=1 Tax=Hondaea fermentalgiana TaxID=2315210 RepID=A0A2R5GHY0_9STRA|nr:C-1-tetrahydrofolate synthase, cytoplasmic [Hondaea fermentalgiana]|eukprot:GBG28263.1 C-1-tetrahydrofolate synthase, cytoplasmic [Hondaea fermentalgiana]